MKTQKESKLRKLIWRYKKVIIVWFALALFFISSSILIYYFSNTIEEDSVRKVVADLLMTIGQSIIGAGLIGGGIGGVVNFIYEEFKQEEEEAKEKIKERQENREKQILFRKKMQDKLQSVHDNVELARVLIKSHKSGKTYGEQIRTRIMPSLISLRDFKRRLHHVEDRQLKKNLHCLQVSLTYMIAYLTVLMEEFEANYIEISNLQNYQDALVNRMRTLFTEITESKKGELSLEKKMHFLESAEKLFGDTDVPSNIEVVWQAMERLHYLWDFIGDFRNEKGIKSMYYQHFLQHYFHCNGIIKTKDGKINQKLTGKEDFVANLEELKRIEEKKNSDDPLTKQDSLTRKIMENELHFDFETSKFASS